MSDWQIPESAQLRDQQRGYCLEDLREGMSAVFGKTVTDADVGMFAAVSGDTNPFHLNEEFAAETRFGGRIVHGLLTASLISTLVGCRLPGPGGIYMRQSLRFLTPVRVGDTVHAQATVSGINTEKQQVTLETTCFVGGRAVVAGEALVWVPTRVEKT